MRRWRWFLLAIAGLFGYAGGSEWGISHYRLKAADQAGLKLVRA
jgi:cyclopropane-fatty-acyl-phospholipid synthase